MNVDVNGTTLHVEQEGTGPDLVFVHGMCGDGRVWADQVSRLCDRFRCTTYDRRGHSRSARSGAAHTVELHADDLAGLIEQLGLSSCVAVGSSGGARVVVALIHRHPDIVRGVVVSEPPLSVLVPELFSEMLAAVVPRVKAAADAGGPRAAVDAFFEAVCPGLWAMIDEPVKDRYRDNADMLFADLGMPPYPITLDALTQIDVPALVIGGTHSQPALLAGARALADHLPHAGYRELDCGHVTYAEQPEAFASAVVAFLAELHEAR
jgi:pimeloyl-ACP methyl ester carboxylesterase